MKVDFEGKLSFKERLRVGAEVFHNLKKVFGRIAYYFSGAKKLFKQQVYDFLDFESLLDFVNMDRVAKEIDKFINDFKKEIDTIEEITDFEAWQAFPAVKECFENA